MKGNFNWKDRQQHKYWGNCQSQRTWT